MSAQNDILSGFDFSAVSTLTQEQLMQGINQAAPLDNIGFIVVSTTRPDITSNPRFIRFLWLDISAPSNPQIKHYIGDRTVLADVDASWTSVAVEDLAILTSSFAARSATGGVNVALLKLNADYSATLSSSYYVIRVAANGKDIEAVSLNQALLDGGGVPLIRLDTTGLAAGKFIGFNAGVAGYVPIVPSTDLIGAARIAAETNILPGTARYVPRTNAGATAMEHVTPNDLFSDGELALGRLDEGGAAINDILRFNGTLWVKATPSLEMVGGKAANLGTLVAASGGTIANAQTTFTHDLGTTPKLIRVVAIQTVGAEGGYTANVDEIDINAFHDGNQVASVSANTTTIFISCRVTAGASVIDKAGGGSSAITEGNFQWKVYAWK